MKTSSKGTTLIKTFESFVDHVYICPAGKPTIGYGHVVLKGEILPTKITICEADILLSVDLVKFEQLVQRQVTVPINQNQFDALVCFSFNTGCIGKTMLKKLNLRDYGGAAQEFDKWVYATVDGQKVALPGLIRRRATEKALFLT